jgi:hypothetical protein
MSRLFKISLLMRIRYIGSQFSSAVLPDFNIMKAVAPALLYILSFNREFTTWSYYVTLHTFNEVFQDSRQLPVLLKLPFLLVIDRHKVLFLIMHNQLHQIVKREGVWEMKYSWRKWEMNLSTIPESKASREANTGNIFSYVEGWN